MNITDLYLIINSRCNLKCPFCIRKNLTFMDGMSMSTVCQIFESIEGIFDNIGSVIITGGEPTLHPNFFDIVDMACNRFKRVLINSNGVFSTEIAEALKERMAHNLYVQISLDGLKGVHDKLRGNGSFEKTVNSINAFSEASSHLIISTTVGKANIESVKDMPEFLEGLSFRYWKVSQEQIEKPSVNAIIDNNIWNAFVDLLINKSCFMLSIKKMFDFNLMKAYLAHGVELNNCIRNCGYGKENVYINSSKNILYCSCVNKVIGNLDDDEIETIRYRVKNSSSVVIPPESICSKCAYKLICNSGCPGYSLKFFGKIGMGDIRCPKVRRAYFNPTQ